jgi:hypothetical protein
VAFDARISFDQWIRYVFDHPVTNPITELGWSHNMDAVLLEALFRSIRPEDVIAYLTRTFEECDTVLSPFSDAQVNQGLHFLVSAESDYMHDLKDTDVNLPDRLRCIHAMATLFERCFARRLPSDQPSHEGTNPLHQVCYIWWDALPLHYLSYKHPDEDELDRAIVTVLRRILELDSVACQESALFTLADWQTYPEVSENISDFLDRKPSILEKLSPALRKYVVEASLPQ